MHTCGQKSSDTTLYCWGRNSDYGQLGLGDLTSRTLPTPLPGAWLSVGVGSYHSCAISSEKRLSCWGINSSGALGDRTAWREAPETVLWP